METRSWKDPRDGKGWTVELHTSRREGEHRRIPVFWLRFRGNGNDRVLPVTQRELDAATDDELEAMLDAAEPNDLPVSVWYHVSPAPEQEGGTWIARAQVFASNESAAWEESVLDPEGKRLNEYEDAAKRSRTLGRAHVRSRFAR